MKITRVELDSIKQSNGFHSDNEAYKWILKTFPENIFFDNITIMELINEAKSMLDEKFYIRVSNQYCKCLHLGYICTHNLHPDYNPFKTAKCGFEQCPLSLKYKPLTEEEKETIEEGQRIEMDSLKSISDRFR